MTPKNGFLYGFDLSNNQMLYRKPVTRVENADTTFSTGKAVHFCPGSVGGATKMVRLTRQAAASVPGGLGRSAVRHGSAV